MFAGVDITLQGHSISSETELVRVLVLVKLKWRGYQKVKELFYRCVWWFWHNAGAWQTDRH